MWSRFNVKHTIKKTKLIDLCGMKSTLTKFPYNMYRKYTTQEAWKLKTKQDAPSIQLLPHILHEIARTYVYAIELSIHTTISTRKSYSLFYSVLNLSYCKFPSKFHSTITKFECVFANQMNSKIIKWKTFEKFLTKN